MLLVAKPINMANAVHQGL